MPSRSPLVAPWPGCAEPPLTQHPDTRSRLLAAALDLVKCQGIQAMTQARVAERAGLRQSHVTYHFPTRSHLLAAVAAQGAADTLRYLDADSEGGPATLEGFRSMMAEHVSTSAMPRLMLALTLASEEDHSLKAWMSSFEEGARAHLQASFVRFGVLPGADELALFHATLVGIATLQIGSDHADSATRARNLFCQAFDRLVAAAHPVPTGP